MIELAVRMVFSLAVVLGLLLLCARLGARRFKGRTSSPLQVLHRQSLSRGSGLALVSVGGRVLLLGTTDQQVQMLTELDPATVDVPAPAETDEAEDIAPAVEPDSLFGRTARLVEEPVRWLEPRRASKRGLAAAAVAASTAPCADPAGSTPADLAPVQEAEVASFAATLEAELEAELKAAVTAPRLTPAQVLLSEERTPGAPSGPLTGSLLSPDTWRLAARAVTRRAS
jgi:flagellar protein FliO/FliZ